MRGVEDGEVGDGKVKDGEVGCSETAHGTWRLEARREHREVTW